MLDRLVVLARGSGADADAALAAAVAVALAVAEEAERPAAPAAATPVAGLSPWLLEGRRRQMDSHGRATR